MIAEVQSLQPGSPGLAVKLTAEEFAQRFDGRRAELINGVPVELPMPGLQQGKVCFRIAMAIGLFVDVKDLGHVMTNDSFVRVGTKDDPDRIRGADVCFFAHTAANLG